MDVIREPLLQSPSTAGNPENDGALQGTSGG